MRSLSRACRGEVVCPTHHISKPHCRLIKTMHPFAFCIWRQKNNELAWKTLSQTASYRHYMQFSQLLPHLLHIRKTISGLSAEPWARHILWWLTAAGWQYRKVGHSLKS
eukprot:jgi/Mesvir1/21844/Mv26179-RA.1